MSAGASRDRDASRSAAGLRLALCSDTFAPQVNGVARTLDQLVAAVEARGGDVCVLTVTDPEAPPRDRVSRVGAVPFWAYPQLRMAAPADGPARQMIRNFNPNLVHAATPFGVGLGAKAAAKQRDVPLVTSYHTHFAAYLNHYKLDALDGISWPFLRWFHNSGARTYAPSETVRRELERRGFLRTRVWSRGVDDARFNPRFRSRARRTAFGARDDQLVVLYVGRLAPEKGIENAIAGVSRAMDAKPGRFVFVVTGDGPANARARETAPEGTVFTGTLHGRELSEVFASADVFVFPSLTETFGNVVLEAMASGLAVIAPDRGPTLEFAHAATAAVCDVSRPLAIADRLLDLAADPLARGRLVGSALSAARERTWDRVFDALVADYWRIVGGIGAGAVA